MVRLNTRDYKSTKSLIIPDAADAKNALLAMTSPEVAGYPNNYKRCSGSEPKSFAIVVMSLAGARAFLLRLAGIDVDIDHWTLN